MITAKGHYTGKKKEKKGGGAWGGDNGNGRQRCKRRRYGSLVKLHHTFINLYNTFITADNRLHRFIIVLWLIALSIKT